MGTGQATAHCVSLLTAVVFVLSSWAIHVTIAHLSIAQAYAARALEAGRFASWKLRSIDWDY